MDLHKAFEIVLSLARQNIIDQIDMPSEHTEQREACDIVEDYVVNHLGDE
jgi:hypothetical protein